MLQTIVNLSPILIFFSLGYGVKKSGIELRQWPHRINQFAIRFIFPAVILLSVPQLDLSGGIYFAVVSPWLCILIASVTILSLSRVLKWPREIEAALLILAALGNTGFLGVPMIQSLFGLEYVAIGVIYDQLGTFIAVTTYATIVIAIYGGEGDARVKTVIRRVLLFPPFITLIVALFLEADTLEIVTPLLKLMAASVIPLTMFSIGMQFSFKTESTVKAPLIIGLAVKMILLPVLIGLLGYGLSISDSVLQVSIFQSATPPMVTGAVLLTAHNIAPKFVSSVLGFGTLVALIWLPFVFIILNG